jgi:hypothetical protein
MAVYEELDFSLDPWEYWRLQGMAVVFSEVWADYSPNFFETASSLAFSSFPLMDHVVVSSLWFLASNIGSAVPMGQMSAKYSQVGLVDQPRFPAPTRDNFKDGNLY